MIHPAMKSFLLIIAMAFSALLSAAGQTARLTLIPPLSVTASVPVEIRAGIVPEEAGEEPVPAINCEAEATATAEETAIMEEPLIIAEEKLDAAKAAAGDEPLLELRPWVRRTAARLTGQEPFIIEHFAVDPNDPACRNPALYRRLYGEDPYRFFLLLPQGTFEKQQDMERFIERMGQLTPAETEMELVLLKPCIQLDWHTYLGINSRIGDYIPAAIDDSVTIHYDTTIGGAYE